MSDLLTILATDTTGTEISVGDVQDWIIKKNKKQLAQLFYDRLYGRYLKPFDYKNPDYQKEFKNGFAIMVNCCLLIETYVSFKDPIFLNTHGKSERCFGYFFLTNRRFAEFSQNGLTIDQYKDLSFSVYKNNKGIPKDFYSNVRCGILHSGETKNGWKISRKGEFYDENSKRINVTKFANRLRHSLRDFQTNLEIASIDSDKIWRNYLAKLSDIINRT